MSCPYLEKGWRARCRAFGNQGIGIKLPDMEDSCFSGEFSECAFLFAPVPGPGKKALSPSVTGKRLRRILFPQPPTMENLR
jgi:hypothetical protein